MRPRITVLMPVWNRAHLVRQAVQSILDQTFTDYELLIVDDGSTDGTRQIIDEMVNETNPRIRVLKKKHTGLVDTLNQGNWASRGEIIVKQDSDDISLPNRLERIDQFFRDWPGTDLLYTGMYRVWEMDNGLSSMSYIPALPLVEKRLLKEQYAPGTFAYTRKFMINTPYRPEVICSEDWMLLLDAFYRKANIGLINEGLYQYIPRDDSHSFQSEDSGRYEADEAAMQKILKDEYGIKNFHYAPRA